MLVISYKKDKNTDLPFLLLAVYLFDVHTGKPLSTIENGMFRHYIDVVDVALNQSSSKGPNSGGGASGRQMVIVDKNRDMWLIGLIKFQPKKLGK